MTLLWLLVSLGPVVTVEGDAVCPTAADVATRLGALLPAGETEAPDVARVEARGSGLYLTLARPDGTPIGERGLEGGFPCADLAAAAAVIFATWESDVHPEFRLAVPPPPPPSPPPVPPPPPSPPVVVVAPPAPAEAAHWDVGAGVSGSVATGSGGMAPAMGAIVVGTWTPGSGRLGARLALDGTLERELPLGTGSVRWQRADAALGAQLRLGARGATLAVDLFGEALAGWLVATGNGFTNDLSAGSLDPGLGAGARLRLGQAPWVPWLEASVTGWLRRQTAYASPGGASVELPRFEAALALGLSYGP